MRVKTATLKGIAQLLHDMKRAASAEEIVPGATEDELNELIHWAWAIDPESGYAEMESGDPDIDEEATGWVNNSDGVAESIYRSIEYYEEENGDLGENWAMDVRIYRVSE